MKLILDAVITGILTGGIYALMASGLTLIFGVMDIINVGQGALVILGAYLSYHLAAELSHRSFLGAAHHHAAHVPPGRAAGAGLHPAAQARPHHALDPGHLCDRSDHRGCAGHSSLRTNMVQLHAWYVDASFQIGGFYLAYIYIFGFALSIVLLAGLYLLFYRTKFGSSLRASMQNRTAAQLIGIDVERVSAITFGIGVALAAAGGMAYGATYRFQSRQPLRPDLTPAGDHHSGGHGQPAGSADRFRWSCW